MVKTGARASVLGATLVAAGLRISADRPAPPRTSALTASLRSDICAWLVDFGGRTDALDRLRPGSWDLVFDDGLVVELDEELHFNRYRARTLQAPWAQGLPWTAPYLRYCSDDEAACLAAAKWGKRWTNPSCERLFGVAAPAGSFEGNGAPRWKQRALYDAIKDAFALSQQEYRLARVAVYDDIEGRTLEEVLRSPRPDDAEAVAELVRSRMPS